MASPFNFIPKWFIAIWLLFLGAGITIVGLVIVALIKFIAKM